MSANQVDQTNIEHLDADVLVLAKAYNRPAQCDTGGQTEVFKASYRIRRSHSRCFPRTGRGPKLAGCRIDEDGIREILADKPAALVALDTICRFGYLWVFYYEEAVCTLVFHGEKTDR